MDGQDFLGVGSWYSRSNNKDLVLKKLQGFFNVVSNYCQLEKENVNLHTPIIICCCIVGRVYAISIPRPIP
jgi:hypothetical protein